YAELRANGHRVGTQGPGGYTYTAQGGGPGVFDLGDLFGQIFTQQQQRGGGRVRVERVDFDPFERGGAAGEDAEFESKVKAADGTWLRVEGNDVHSDLRISFDRAILGTVASVATIDGKADVKVPPGTSGGKKLRLRGKGVTGRSGRTGDHYVTVQ